MKKSVLVLSSILILFAFTNVTIAKTAVTNPATSAAIKLYKAGNYTSAYSSLQEIVKKDKGNALAVYYLAMTEVQLGKTEEAIKDYETVIKMSPNGVLGSYAKKGKKCVATPEKCHEPEAKPGDNDTEEDKFIKGIYRSNFTKEARGMHEQQKINNLKREINRQEEMTPQRFKEYKDFSSQAPSNDEIVEALRTLQRAGLSDVLGRHEYDSSDLLGINNTSRNEYDMLNQLFSANKSGTSNLSPQVIQSLLTTQMTTGF